MENNYNYKYLEFDDENLYKIKEQNIKIKTIDYEKNKKLGVMIVGLCGNNGSTFIAGLLASKKKLSWENKNGKHQVEFLGSLSQFGSVNLGYDTKDKVVSKLIKEMVPIRDTKDIIISGWDIINDDLYTSCKKNKVIDPDLLYKLKPDLESIGPLSSICYEGFIASNQEKKCNNLKNNNSKKEDLESIKKDIENFKKTNNLDKVIVLWSASTEKMNEIENFNKDELLKEINNNSNLISPSLIFAVASIQSKCIFINTSPQNTITKGILELANEYNTFVGGNDLKSGQTKLKSVLVDFLASSGIRPLSIVSYNHLGNNDGLNLSEKAQFESKEITKKNVIDDVVSENPILFRGKRPDHEVVIKYVPSVGDAKRAIDEYYSELFLDGRNILSIYNLCEDSLLAVPILLDIVLFSELFSRIYFKIEDDDLCNSFSTNLSLLSFFFKAPVEDNNHPVINSFFKQRYGLENFIKACCGIPINDFINLHKRI